MEFYYHVHCMASVIDDQSYLLVMFMCVCVCVCCVETLPEYSDHYYGFTQYAIELNELTDDLTEQLPICDTRFRPDQR